MFIVKLKTPLNDLSIDPNFAKLKQHLAKNRFNAIKKMQEIVAEKEEKTGFSNYSSHVIEAAVFYSQGLSQYSELDAQSAFDKATIIDKIHISRVLYYTASASVSSAFKAAEQYSRRNILNYRIRKVIKTLNKHLHL